MLKIAVTATPSQPRLAPFLSCGDIAAAFRQAAALGCQGVEIHLRRVEDLDARTVRWLSACYGLEVPTVGTGIAAAVDGLTFSDRRAEVRAAALERVREHIGFAAEVGAAIIIGSLSGRLGDCEDGERRERRRRAIECLARVCALAAQAGVTVLLEPLNRYECDYINTLAGGVEMAAETGAPNLMLLADTFHMNIEEADMAASLKAAGSRVGHVHLADTNRQAPGRGHLDLAGVLDALASTGYRGYLSFETLPLPNADEAIRGGIRAVRAAMNRTVEGVNA
jgi:5-keto-L-gluconate epimerase